MDQQIFAHISFDGVHLLLPQPAVAAIEMASNIETNNTTTDAIGVLRSSGYKWPVFVLDANFSLRAACPDSYKYCIAIDFEGEQAFSIACENVSSIAINDETGVTPLQVCMRTADCPIEALIMINKQVMFIGEIASLRQMLVPRVLS